MKQRILLLEVPKKYSEKCIILSMGHCNSKRIIHVYCFIKILNFSVKLQLEACVIKHVSKKTDSNENTLCPVVLSPYIRYSGMCRPKGYGF